MTKPKQKKDDINMFNKSKLISIVIVIFTTIILYPLGTKIYCLKLKKDFGLEVGIITKIIGREINEVEYAEYEYTVDNIHFTGTTIIHAQNVQVGRKYLVTFCLDHPKKSVLLMNESLDDRPLDEISKEKINIPLSIF